MLDKIKQFFQQELEQPAQENPQTLQLAAAALLIELTRADFQSQPEEIKAVEQALQSKFDLEPDKLTALIALADEEVRNTTSLYQFTRLINDHYQPEQKFRLIVAMWQVALADGELSKYEDHLIRKIADLLYVPHSEFIRAKLAVIGD